MWPSSLPKLTTHTQVATQRCRDESKRVRCQLVGDSVGSVAITTLKLVGRLTRWKLAIENEALVELF
jgi:hypothetical protein